MAIFRDLVGRLTGEEPAPAFDLAECGSCRTLVINPAARTCPKCGEGQLAPADG